MIKFEQVSKTYPGGQRALSKVNFHIAPGEMAFLTGHSGAGKSTLLKLISLMERPTVGRVLINGHDLNAITRRDIAYIRRDIGMIFQSHQLLMDKSDGLSSHARQFQQQSKGLRQAMWWKNPKMMLSLASVVIVLILIVVFGLIDHLGQNHTDNQPDDDADQQVREHDGD